jgi:hypothetical protein
MMKYFFRWLIGVIVVLAIAYVVMYFKGNTVETVETVKTEEIVVADSLVVEQADTVIVVKE